MKLFSGNREIPIKTDTEALLLAALKSVLIAHGDKPTVKGASREFYMERFAFQDALGHQRGDIQVATDGNNGRDFVRLKE